MASALRKMERGLLSDAARLLESNGVADLFDPAVMAQLRAKHPMRSAADRMPNALPSLAPGTARIEVSAANVARV